MQRRICQSESVIWAVTPQTKKNLRDNTLRLALGALVRGLDFDHDIAITRESLTPSSSQGRIVTTNAMLYLPIRKRDMGCHPQTKRRRETYTMTRSGLP